MKFYIKPQRDNSRAGASTVVSYWNSTSNHNAVARAESRSDVVSYWNSTSNHNAPPPGMRAAPVVSYWNSTSNHNPCCHRFSAVVLYLIEILHQTTTIPDALFSSARCILLKFYIKPQPVLVGHAVELRCILLKFYIKPQPSSDARISAYVVSYWNSTSNHNFRWFVVCWTDVVSYWNSTSNHNLVSNGGTETRLYLIEILHQTTTVGSLVFFDASLYLIEILHQTTTLSLGQLVVHLLYLIEILHQTTTIKPLRYFLSSCILLKFYIKPQQWIWP